MQLHSVELSGESDQGPFHGGFDFGGTSVVISGLNGRGKSLVASTVAWCLGLEPLYGAKRSDNTIFAEAARRRLWLDRDTEANVTKSQAQLVLSHRDSMLAIERHIKGGDSDFATIITEEDGNLIERRLQLSGPTMADPTRGFHAFLFRWAGLPVCELLTKTGDRRPIYWENLAALFFIEQINGWAGLQSNQIHRYGHMDIGAACVEYLLGLRRTLQRRTRRQERFSVEGQLRQRSHAVFDRVDMLTTEFVAGAELPKPRRLADIHKRMRDLVVVEHIDKHLRETLRSQEQGLQRQVQELQASLNTQTLQPREENRHLVEAASTSVVELKSLLHEKRQELRRLRVQREQQSDLLGELEAKLRAARDLLLLKRDNLGLPTHVECPTCHQEIQPEQYDLHVHGTEQLERRIDALEAERQAVRRVLNRLAHDQRDLLSFVSEKAQELEERRREVDRLSKAVGQTSEAAVGTVSEIIRCERQIARISRVLSEAELVQAQIDAWNKDYAELEEPEADPAFEAEQRRIASFRDQLRDYLVALEHSAFAASRSQRFALDDAHAPLLNDRLVASTGSASDRPRLVAAYVLALQLISLRDRTEHHPGFIVLDEPLQQNPDERHRASFISFLARNWQELAGQVVLITSLSVEEEETLSGAGVNLVPFSKRQWLVAGQAPDGSGE